MSEAILARSEAWAAEAAALRRWLRGADWAAVNVPPERVRPACGCRTRSAYHACDESAGVFVCREHGSLHICEDGGCVDLVSSGGALACPLTGRRVRMALGEEGDGEAVLRTPRKRARSDGIERVLSTNEQIGIAQVAGRVFGTAEERAQYLGGAPLAPEEARAASECIEQITCLVWARVSRQQRRRARLRTGAPACALCVASILRTHAALCIANRPVCRGSPWFGRNVLPDSALVGRSGESNTFHTIWRAIVDVFYPLGADEWALFSEDVARVMANSGLPDT